MKIKEVLFIAGLIALFTIAIPIAPVLGGIEPAPDPANYKIVGPSMWAVGVIKGCGTGAIIGTLRVKKIEGCDVDTDPQAITDITCPLSGSNILFYRLPPGSVFGRCPSYEPIITKVKNFKNEGDIVSFDAQIQFVVPISASDDVCTTVP